MHASETAQGRHTTGWSTTDAGVGAMLYAVVADHRKRDAELEGAVIKARGAYDAAEEYPDPALPHMRLLHAAFDDDDKDASVADRDADPPTAASARPDNNTAESGAATTRHEEAMAIGLLGQMPGGLTQVSRAGLHPGFEGGHDFNSMLKVLEMAKRYGPGLGWVEVDGTPGASYSPTEATRRPMPNRHAEATTTAASTSFGRRKRMGRVARPWLEDPANSEVCDAGLTVRRVPRGQPVSAIPNPPKHGKTSPMPPPPSSSLPLHRRKPSATTLGTDILEERDVVPLHAGGGGGAGAEGVHFGRVPEQALLEVAQLRETRVAALRVWRREVALARAEAPRYATDATGDPVLIHTVQQATVNREEDQVTRANIARMKKYLDGETLDDPTALPQHNTRTKTTKELMAAHAAGVRRDELAGRNAKLTRAAQSLRSPQRLHHLQATTATATATTARRPSNVRALGGPTEAEVQSAHDLRRRFRQLDHLSDTARAAASARVVHATQRALQHRKELVATNERLQQHQQQQQYLAAENRDGDVDAGGDKVADDSYLPAPAPYLPLRDLCLETAVAAEEDMPYLEEAGVHFMPYEGQLLVVDEYGLPHPDLAEEEGEEEGEEEDGQEDAAADDGDDEDELSDEFSSSSAESSSAATSSSAADVRTAALGGSGGGGDQRGGTCDDATAVGGMANISNSATAKGRRRAKGRGMLAGTSVLTVAKTAIGESKPLKPFTTSDNGGKSSSALVVVAADDVAARDGSAPAPHASVTGPERFASGVGAVLMRDAMHGEAEDPAVTVADVARKLQQLLGKPLTEVCDDAPMPIDRQCVTLAGLFERKPRLRWLADIVATLRTVDSAIVSGALFATTAPPVAVEAAVPAAAVTTPDDISNTSATNTEATAAVPRTSEQPASAADAGTADAGTANAGSVPASVAAVATREAAAAASVTAPVAAALFEPGPIELPTAGLRDLLANDPRIVKSRSIAWLDQQLMRFAEECLLEAREQLRNFTTANNNTIDADGGEPELAATTRRRVAELEAAVAEAKAVLRPPAEFLCAVGGHVMREPCALPSSLTDVPIDDSVPFSKRAVKGGFVGEDDDDDSEGDNDDDDVANAHADRTVLVDRPTWDYVQATRRNEECEDEEAWSAALVCLEPQPLPHLERRIWQWRRRVAARAQGVVVDARESETAIRAVVCSAADDAVWRSDVARKIPPSDDPMYQIVTAAAASGSTASLMSEFTKGRFMGSPALVVDHHTATTAAAAPAGSPSGAAPRVADWPTLQHVVTCAPGSTKARFVPNLDRFRIAAQSALRTIKACAARRDDLRTLRSVIADAVAAIDVEAAGVSRDGARKRVPLLPSCANDAVVRSAIARGCVDGSGFDEKALIDGSIDSGKYRITDDDTRDASWFLSGMPMRDQPGSVFRKQRGLHQLLRRVTLMGLWIDAAEHVTSQTIGLLQPRVDEYNRLAKERERFWARHRLEWGPKFNDTLRCAFSIVSMIRIGTMTTAGNMDQLVQVSKFLRVDVRELLSHLAKYTEQLEAMLKSRNLRVKIVEWGSAEYDNFSAEAEAADTETPEPLPLLQLPDSGVSGAATAGGGGGGGGGGGAASPTLPTGPAVDPFVATVRLALARWRQGAPTVRADDRLVPVASSSATAKDDNGDGDERAPHHNVDDAQLVERMRTLSPASLAVAYTDALPYRDAMRALKGQHMASLRAQRQRISRNPNPDGTAGTAHAASPEELARMRVAAKALSCMAPSWTAELADVNLPMHQPGAPALSALSHDDMRNRTLARPVGEDRRVPWWHFPPPVYFVEAAGGGGAAHQSVKAVPQPPSTGSLARVDGGGSVHAKQHSPPVRRPTASSVRIDNTTVRKLAASQSKKGRGSSSSSPGSAPPRRRQQGGAHGQPAAQAAVSLPPAAVAAADP